MTQGADDRGRSHPAGLPSFSELRSETRDALDAMCRARRYQAGETVVHAGQTSGFIGCVLSGILRMQKPMADGRQHIAGLLVERDMFGRVFDGAMEFSVEAATEAVVNLYPRAPFEALLLRSPDLERVVLLNMLNELDRARDWMVLLSNHRIVSRVAGFLLLMCSRFASVDHFLEPRQNGVEVKIPIGREDLAHLLGTRPESLSRALHALQDEGEIRLLAPNRVLIRNFQGLAEKAGEDRIAGIASLKDVLDAKRM